MKSILTLLSLAVLALTLGACAHKEKTCGAGDGKACCATTGHHAHH